MATQKLTDKTLVEVINTSSGSVSYKPEMSMVSRKWEKQNAVKRVELGELKSAMATVGAHALFAEGLLLVKDNAIREELGLEELSQYVKTAQEIKELLAGSKSDLVDFVENCSQDMLDAVVNIAIEIGLSDLNKLKVIEDYSGVKIVDHVKEQKEEKTTEQKPTTGGAKRKPRQPKAE